MEIQIRAQTEPAKSKVNPTLVSTWSLLTAILTFGNFVYFLQIPLQPLLSKVQNQFQQTWYPKSVVSDNGSQFVSEEFANSVREWEFSHKPTSPYHSQSNRIAEAAVKIAKTMLKKAHKDKKDPWLVILNWRNTPTEQIGTNPVQRLMSRRTRACLPTVDGLLNPEVVTGVTQKIKKKRKKAKLYYDRTARQLPEIVIGDYVFVDTWLILKRQSEDVTGNSSDPQMRKVREKKDQRDLSWK